ncbi:MAG: hypothetical protein JXA82_12715 [Sedimentisphaerales bacterium]|nr:hypothetical protein [Sedimentisphaerales bacterium]
MIQPLHETMGIVFLTGIGIFTGRILWNKPKYWILGYILPLAILAFLLAGRISFLSDLLPVLHRISMSRMRYVFLTLAITIGLMTPLPRLPHRFEKVLLSFVLLAFVGYFCILPFLYPVLLERRLHNMNPRIDVDGICRQSQGYTCGPAAAATALRIMGYPATEAELAVLGRSSPITGTLAQTLSRVIDIKYTDQGLQCNYEHLGTIEQLARRGIALVVLREGLLIDHCVTVLQVNDSQVVLADPERGINILSHADFYRSWKGWAITFRSTESLRPI